MSALPIVTATTTQIHPTLEKVLWPRLDHPAILDLLEPHPSPSEL